MNRTRRLFSTGLVLSGLLGATRLVAAQGEGRGKEKDKGQGKAKAKHKHHDGAKLLGERIKGNGKHVIEKNGPHTVSLSVKDGKIAGMRARHDTKGELPIKKYKTSKKMAQAGTGLQYAGFIPVQHTYLGTTYIGYSYYDDYGDESIYWFPYDMVLDGDTGAIEYVPA